MAECGEMRWWLAASVMFFTYLVLMAPRVRVAGRRRLVLLVCGAAAGLIMTAVFATVRESVLLHNWVAPPMLLLTGYWTSGLLFVAPRPAQERVLLDLDRRLRILRLARSMPLFVAELLEIAYIGVYPLIPIALALYLLFVPAADPDRFWSVILIIDYVCFGALAWVQTRPPRALQDEEPWPSWMRRLNLHIVGAASVRVNTFPSGHAAEALAAALLVIGAPWPVVAWTSACAIGVSAGAVFGRYHYAGDAIAGWAVALVVWAVFR